MKATWHTYVSIIGGVLIGNGIVLSFEFLGWWGIAALPVWLFLLLLVLFVPYRIDEWVEERKVRARWKK